MTKGLMELNFQMTYLLYISNRTNSTEILFIVAWLRFTNFTFRENLSFVRKEVRGAEATIHNGIVFEKHPLNFVAISTIAGRF